MKKYFISIFMAMVASMCVATFTACGGSDDDDIGGESGNLTVGTHRVDVEFSGETAGWNVSLTFLGTDKNVTKASRHSSDLCSRQKRLARFYIRRPV